ncbi:MAG: hypothetical protein JNL08_15950 [Planctomycetes bacterium]|nr:hypothetical protein [Planctomycetota bacterium]
MHSDLSDRPRRRGPKRTTATLLCAVLAACSAADNLSFAELATELDGIVSVGGEGDARTIVYATEAEVSAWYMRQFWLWPFRWGLGPVFGYRGLDTLENPAGHVRELLVELPDETGSDLVRCAQAATRLGWIAAADRNGHSRVVAMDGLVQTALQAELPLFTRDFAELGATLPDERRAALQRAVEAGRPEARVAAWDETRRTGYAAALVELTRQPLVGWSQQLVLVADLIELHATEPDAELQAVTLDALRAAMVHCVEGILLRATAERDVRFADVRLCAMEQVRRLAGPRGVPLLLAVLQATPQQRARLEPQFDPDPLVSLRLIHYCGQLRGPAALVEVRLPGRESWQAIAPVDFLAQTVLNEQAYYSKLRTPALAALSLSLGRPTIDPDPAWVREWYRERHSRGVRDGG